MTMIDRRCPCGHVSTHAPHTAAYHVEHRAVHLAKFPASTPDTRRALDYFVRLAESGRMLAPPAAEAVTS